MTGSNRVLWLATVSLPLLGCPHVMAQDTSPQPKQPGQVEDRTNTSPTAPDPATQPKDDDAQMAPEVEATEAPAAAPETTIDYVALQDTDEWRSTQIIGLDVYNRMNEKIGDINDLIVAEGSLKVAVIGVGGLLGLAEKSVGVPFDALEFTRTAEGDVRVTLDSTKDALEKAPDYKYNEDR